MRRALFAVGLTLAAAAPPRALHDLGPGPAKMYAEGSIAEAADALAQICLAHPTDIAAQRRIAIAPPFRMTREPEANTYETYSGGLLQLSVDTGPSGNLCAVLTPFVNMPTMADAARELRAKLRLPGAGQVQGEAMKWVRTVGGVHEIVGLAFTHQGPNQGAVLTLSAKKV